MEEHTYTTTNTIDIDTWREDFLGKTLVDSNSYVVLNNKFIQGVVCLYKDNDSYYLGYIVFKNYEVLNCLLYHLKQSLIKSNINDIALELNENNSYTAEFMSKIDNPNIQPKQIWETYFKGLN